MSGKEALRKTVATKIKLIVPSGAARPVPPVGPVLGQAGLNTMAFCKDFNARTQKYKPDIPLSVKLIAYKDKSFEFTIRSPSVSWFLKKAAGLDKASSRPGHLAAASLSIKHVYEIAKLKSQDPGSEHLPLESICKSVVASAKSMGINIVNQLD